MPPPDLTPQTPAEALQLANDPDLSLLHFHATSEHGTRHTLIASLLVLGKPDEARMVAKLPEHVNVIERHVAAIQRPDDQWCKCEHVPTPAAPLQHQVVTTTWSDWHNGIVKHYRCVHCGVENATPQPPNMAHDKLKEMMRNGNSISDADLAEFIAPFYATQA